MESLDKCLENEARIAYKEDLTTAGVGARRRKPTHRFRKVPKSVDLGEWAASTPEGRTTSKELATEVLGRYFMKRYLGKSGAHVEADFLSLLERLDGAR